MFAKLVCFAALAFAMLVCDVSAFGQARFKERAVYGGLLVCIFYLGFLFVTEKRWPNLDTLFNLFTGPAKRIVSWLNPTASSS
ncbi:hypothetical protein [Cohnella terricola]|uniref:Uncharacterized protein n=1 Tax=Cohnella terricola TaxID=1289167 RepID=A0A559JQ42_9BACL|nr:hypothetical protein [Cohnella terricola]TVY01999.1 hypothetical protein FPZ45_06020 [Cohnella terricola]